MNNIHQNRTLPHKSSGKLVNRTELIEKLSQNRQKGIFLISGPAGYGKSSLALEFLNTLNLKYSWLNVHTEMSNFYVFMNYLVFSLKRTEETFGNSTLQMIEDYRDKFKFDSHREIIINDIVGIFMNELSITFEDEFYIVLDDFGKVTGAGWEKDVFDKLLEDLPANFHLIITTRVNPDISTGVLQAKRNLLRIGMKELAFTASETETLVNKLYGLNITGSEVYSLSQDLDGWITGIHLILQSYGSTFPQQRFDKIKVLDDVFNYFTEDIFNALKPDVREFLLSTSLLEEFTPRLCDELLNTDRSSELIKELLQQNIFIQSNSSINNENPVSYSYQELFKEFLNLKLQQTRSKTEIHSLLKKISEYYEVNKQFVEAINFSILAGELESAAEMIKKQYNQLFERGLFELLWKWLDDLGSVIINKEYKLLYLRSLLLKFFKGNIEESLQVLDTAIELCYSSNDTEFLVICSISKSRNLISLGRVSEAIKVLKKANGFDADPAGKAKLIFLMAYAYYQNSEYDRSLDLLNSAAEILNTEENRFNNTKELKLDIFNLYGHIFLIRGDYSKSISYYERSLKNTNKIFGRYETICNLVLLYSQSGRFERAAVYLEEARSIAENISIPIFRITYLLARQAFKFEFGDYEESIKLLEEMNGIAADLNHKYYIFLSYSLIGDSYYSLDKLSKAEEYYDLAFRYLNDDNELERIQFAVCKAFLLIKTDPGSKIEPVLLDAYNYYDNKKITYSKIQISFHLADFYFREKNYERSLQLLQEVLKISEEKEYHSFIQREISNFRQLFDFALANKLYSSYIKLQNAAFLEKKNSVLISAECRRRLQRINESLLDIQLNLLGKCEVRVRGKIIDDSGWTKKKWKFIFIYLMLEPGRSITKDKFIDIFYPDTPMESADNIFHQVISKFRNLVKFSYDTGQNKKTDNDDVKKKKSSRNKKNVPGLTISPNLVSYEDKLLEISDDFTYYIDSAEFETLYRQLSTNKDTLGRTVTLQKAIALYKGDFMEGNYDTWCEELRSRYRSYFVTMSEELIRNLHDTKDHEGVIFYAENLLKYDKLSLAAYEFIIRSLIDISRPQIAKVRYSQLLKSYKREYDESLPQKFLAKFEELLTN